MPKIAFYTLGCKSNQYETETLRERALAIGFTEVPHDQEADVYLINTCTVTGIADKKSRHAIRAARRKNQKALVIATGCYAEVAPEEIANIGDADLILPNREKTNIVKYLRNVISSSKEENPPQGYSSRTRSFLMIEDGCEHKCSYCVIPRARGKIVSKPLPYVTEEAKTLVNRGAKEIILTGINLAAYGLDEQSGQSEKQNTLPNVLKALSEIDGLLRIRISSLEPMFIDKKLIDSISKFPKVCPHFHIPLQSGDNNVLKAMNRNYTIQKYSEIVDHIRKKIKNASINTDIIVGFPGEGDSEFKNTIKAVNKLKFSRMHIFTYSHRKGTSAEYLPAVDPKIAYERSKILQELRAKYMVEFSKKWQDKEVLVLVEQRDRYTEMLDGLTPHYIRAFFNGGDELIGKEVPVKFKTINPEFVIGENTIYAKSLRIS